MKKINFLKAFALVIFCSLLLNISNVFAQDYLFNENEITEAHTKKEIIQKMNDIIKYNYNNSEYAVNPSIKAPYAAGSLQQGVIQDTLRSINFYRWLVGLNPVTVKYDKMERNQKGAVVLAANRVLSHTPTKPADMDEAFYQEAYAGCYFGATPGDYYSGNVSLDSSIMPKIIDGYISDIYNANTSNGAVGHRNSILDPLAYSASFGKAGSYSTLSVYYALSIAQYNSFSQNEFVVEPFFAYPSSGNFPRSLFRANECWSVLFIYSAEYSSSMKATFEYNGKQYVADQFMKEGSEPIVSFKMPAALIRDLGISNSSKMPACSIRVKVEGYKVEDGQSNVTLDYTVNFFDENNIVNDFTLSQTTITLEQGESTTVPLTLSPSGAVADSIVWSTEDTHYIRVSEDGTIRAIRPGTATVKVNVDGIEKTITVNISGNTNFLLGDLDRNGVVDANDASIALELYKSTTGEFDVEDILRGDLDNNDLIDANDASLILELYKTNI